MDFAPCPTCARHVEVREARCPFCGGATPGLRAPRRPIGGATRAAIVYMGAMLASACGPQGTAEQETIAQPYGAPPDPPPDETIAQPYGAPPDPEPVPDDAPEEEPRPARPRTATSRPPTR